MSECKNAFMNEQMRSLTKYEALRIAFTFSSFNSHICEMKYLDQKLFQLCHPNS